MYVSSSMNVLLLVTLLSSVNASCPLLWNSKQNLGLEHGLQVCFLLLSKFRYYSLCNTVENFVEICLF
uniref:Secreted protein n=1 Tax=Ascaris lumbricoides TaxID=6252 RepID=A0A0M3IMJ4_ASCLU